MCGYKCSNLAETRWAQFIYQITGTHALGHMMYGCTTLY